MSEQLRRTVIFKGKQITLLPEEVISAGRQALAAKVSGSDRYRVWYIHIDSRRVGVKWLVSLISNVETSQFITSEARRLLEGLGVALKHL